MIEEVVNLRQIIHVRRNAARPLGTAARTLPTPEMTETYRLSQQPYVGLFDQEIGGHFCALHELNLGIR